MLQKYVIGLDLDNKSKPSCENSLTKLLSFFNEHGGAFQGWLKHDNEELEGDAVVTITPEVAGLLKNEDFVRRLPTAGIHKEISLKEDMTIQYPTYGAGLTI